MHFGWLFGGQIGVRFWYIWRRDLVPFWGTFGDPIWCTFCEQFVRHLGDHIGHILAPLRRHKMHEINLHVSLLSARSDALPSTPGDKFPTRQERFDAKLHSCVRNFCARCASLQRTKAAPSVHRRAREGGLFRAHKSARRRPNWHHTGVNFSSQMMSRWTHSGHRFRVHFVYHFGHQNGHHFSTNFGHQIRSPMTPIPDTFSGNF